jgi:TPP-dependent pyruvate/acetoin dehydrogenase alpha subunit
METNDLLIQCLRIRRIEEAISAIYLTDKIQSPVHLSNGQEYASVGICSALSLTDLVFGTYRSHALYLAKGGGLNSMFAELFGKQGGFAKGRAGSMHLADKSVGVMGASAIVASTIPHAVGAAYAAKIQKKQQVIVCFFGEGATGEGVYHESLNFASKQKLPILFVCENNDLAINANVSDLHAFDVCQHAKAYGLKSSLVSNGSDVYEIYEKAKSIVGEIREQQTPALLEIHVNRLMEHVGPGLSADREKDQVEIRHQKITDPIASLEFSKIIEAKIKIEIEEAIRFAEGSPNPSLESLLEYVN